VGAIIVGSVAITVGADGTVGVDTDIGAEDDPFVERDVVKNAAAIADGDTVADPAIEVTKEIIKRFDLSSGK